MTLPPIPPTDSLYKFSAIGGLILAVLSAYVPWKLNLDTDVLNLDLENASNEAAYRSQGIEELGKDVAQQLQEVELSLKESQKQIDDHLKKPPDAVRAAKLKQRNEQQSVKFEKLRSTTQELKTKMEEARSRSGHFDTINKRLILADHTDSLLWISAITLCIGVILTIFGFWNWYFKFQMYQDQIIKAQAKQWTTPRPDRDTEEFGG